MVTPIRNPRLADDGRGTTAVTTETDVTTEQASRVPNEHRFARRPGIAIVTGGSGGLGAACVRLLVERGAHVLFTYRSNRDRAESIVDDLATFDRHVAAIPLDGTDVEACAELPAAIADHATSAGAEAVVHTLVHAAGPVVMQRHLSTVEPDRFAAQMRAELDACFNVVQPLLPLLREASGSFVAITTAATRRYPARDGLSAVAKGGIEQLVRALAAEEGRYGVRANCVGPGMTDAGMAITLAESGDLHDEAHRVAMGNIPLRRFGSALDIAEAVAFLASDRAGYITGQHLAVDGGYCV